MQCFNVFLCTSLRHRKCRTLPHNHLSPELAERAETQHPLSIKGPRRAEVGHHPHVGEQRRAPDQEQFFPEPAVKTKWMWPRERKVFFFPSTP